MITDCCIGCGCRINVAIDADPNGDIGCVCARCRAESNHDFDREPNVWFDRQGNMMAALSGGEAKP